MIAVAEKWSFFDMDGSGYFSLFLASSVNAF